MNASLVIPISTLYASPEKISRDGFCAFQPNRPMRPSLPFRLTRPLMPKLFLMNEFAFRLLRIAVSAIDSMSPVPNVGVGIRKMMLRLRIWVSKSSCLMPQPAALGWPVITNRA